MPSNLNGQRTVHDLRELLFFTIGTRDYGTFVRRSPAHAQFWEQLNSLGSKRSSATPEETRNIDATAVLTAEEWSELTSQMYRLASVAA